MKYQTNQLMDKQQVESEITGMNQSSLNPSSLNQSGKYPTAVFVSDLKSHSITMELDSIRHEALVSEMKIKYENPVELAMLLKRIVLELKKYNINFVIQQVTKDDWFSVLKEHGIFQFVNENKIYKFYNIKCELERFPEAVMKALSFTDPFVQES